MKFMDMLQMVLTRAYYTEPYRFAGHCPSCDILKDELQLVRSFIRCRAQERGAYSAGSDKKSSPQSLDLTVTDYSTETI